MFLEVGDFLEEKRGSIQLDRACFPFQDCSSGASRDLQGDRQRQTPLHASRTSSSIGLSYDGERQRVESADNKVLEDNHTER